MTSSFKTGARCNLYFCIFEMLVIVVMSLCFKRLPLLAIIGVALFSAAVAITLGVNIHKKFISENAHKRIQSLAFFWVNGLLSVSFDSAQVFVYATLFSAVTIFVFLDPAVSRFHMSVSVLASVVVAAVVSIYTGSQQTMFAYTFGTVVMLVTNWVIVSMTNIITFQQRQNYEQERSLDDLLKVVEAKCDQAQEATRSKSRFLANMSHEIRTPINAVMGMNEMILRESNEPEICNYAGEVKIAAESLLGIVNDILDISKIEAGKLELLSVSYSLKQIINDMYNLFRFKAEGKGLRFEVIADETLPSKLRGDDVRLKEIISNLISNAIKYTHEGSVTFEVRYLGEGKVHFSVKDTGIGIRAEDADRLFNAFDRMEEQRNRSIEGTGLGLNITCALLKMMNTQLGFASVYGEGSEFSFVLEQQVEDTTPIGSLRLQREHEHKAYSAGFTAEWAKVLVVDDNDMNRRVFRQLLKKTGVQITEAAGGRESLELVKTTAFDVIFMDHMMPEMDGIQALNAMREMEDNLSSGAPVIALTANAVVGAEEYYLKKGFDGFLSKPIDHKKLERMLISLLGEENVRIGGAEDEICSEMIALPEIEGFDHGYARLHLSSDGQILDTLRMLRSSIKKDAAELCSYFDELDERLDSYRIKIHSMKSSAALVGIVSLAGMAMELETAARNRESSVIRALHPVFIERWLEYYGKLSVVAEEKNPEMSADEHKQEVEEIFTRIRSAAEDMDVDALDSLSAELERYAFSAEMSEKVEDIRSLILDFRIEEILEHELLS